MELYQLQYFLAIAKQGSFTKAAEELYVSQPSLSAGIKKLELELGVPLLIRRWRGVRLTNAGELLREKAARVLEEHQSILDALRDYQERPVLCIGMLCTLQIQTVTRIIHAFRDLYPEVLVEVRDTHFDELQNWLSQGEIDIAFTSLDDQRHPDQSHILFEQRLLLGVPSQHPFAHKEAVMVSELDKQPYIERIKCEVLTRQSPSIFESMGVEPQVVYRADHEEWVIAMIQAGMGMSIMPEWSPIEGVSYVPLAKMQPMRTIGLEWNDKKNLKIVDLFHSFVVQQQWFDDVFSHREKA